MVELMNKTKKRHALRIAVGITALVLLTVGGASAATPISACTTISAPGEYVLTQNIINSNASTCISITSSNVVFDGAGNTIDGLDTIGTLGVDVYSSYNSNALTNVTVKNLIVTDWFHGIMFWNSSNNTLSNNIANSNSEDGIQLNGNTDNSILTNNTASSNKKGIRLSGSSNNVLTNNTANSNSESGIHLYHTISNIINNNIISLNGNDAIPAETHSGIYLTSSSNNDIYNNYFNNSNNVDFGITYSNKWNITKIPGMNIIGGSYLGGNFWANPGGTGFSQTCADGNNDGICDSAYSLGSNNIDYLPLAYNSGTPTPTPTATPTPTPTPTVTPTPTPSPSTTTGGDVVSRYAGIDGIVQKSEAVQAVMDYFSGIITRQEAISVVMAYFNG